MSLRPRLAARSLLRGRRRLATCPAAGGSATPLPENAAAGEARRRRLLPRAPEEDGAHTAFSWLDAGLTTTASPQGRLLQGVHALDVHSDWIIFQEASARELLGRKAEAYAEPEVAALYLRQQDGTRDAQQEVLDMLLDHLPRRYPRMFSVAGQAVDGRFPPEAKVRISCRGLEREYCVGDFLDFPLKLASLLVQEDLVLMKDHVVVAGSVVFSFSSFGKKRMGMNLEELHAQVPQYTSDLQRPVARFFDRLKVENPCWRTNWHLAWSPAMTAVPERYPMKKNQLSEEERRAVVADLRRRIREVGVARSTFMKTEYQTLRRLPRNSDCILFTIRTFVDPMTALAARPAAARQLALNIRRLEPVEFKNYLGLADSIVRHAVLDYADRAAAGEAAGEAAAA